MKRLLLGAFVLVVLLAGPAHATRKHVFTATDTLWDLSAKYYGDPTLYTILLEVNGIANPRTIPNGITILIPSKSRMTEIAKEKDPARRKELVKNATGGGSSGSTPGKGTKPGAGQTDAVSRERTRNLKESDLSFKRILEGPNMSSDLLLKVDEQ